MVSGVTVGAHAWPAEMVYTPDYGEAVSMQFFVVPVDLQL